jgi:pimeloyl-ACP methyl ester carboxylesterase
MAKKVNPWGFRLFWAVLRAINSFLRSILLLATGWIAFSNLYIKHKLDMAPALPASRKEYESESAGKVSFYASLQGKGRPLVLIHSVNAAASAFELRPVFIHYQGKRPVYALDLPGFGFSDRSNREYSPEFYARVIEEFLETQVKKAADVVALSLSCEFAARAAQSCPKQFHSLVFISPSGLGASQRSSSQSAGEKGFGKRVYSLLSAPLWARPLFDLIATRPSIRFFLTRSFVGPVPIDLVDYAYATSHQPGAENAPLYFLSGQLFTPQALSALYQPLDLPVLVIYDKDGYTGFSLLPELLENKPNWQSANITPTLGLPQFEKMDEVAESLEKFWQK